VAEQAALGGAQAGRRGGHDSAAEARGGVRRLQCWNCVEYCVLVGCVWIWSCISGRV
jgi:hypothetical protein